MISLSQLLIVVLGVGNIFWLWHHFNPKSKLKNQSYEVKNLVHDLSRGGALVRMERVDPEDVFLRSPRDR